MVSTSKTLTVSYGTFSCTLEGFDDSFGTMKSIAEYFRGLAADDRYFGAEPPVPDAEMLARIAEGEISRRVEARQEPDRLLLRAEPDSATPQHEEPPPAEATTMEAAPAEPAPRQRETARPYDANSAASRLQRIRAVVAKADQDIAPQNYCEGEHAESLLADREAAQDTPPPQPIESRAEETPADPEPENRTAPNNPPHRDQADCERDPEPMDRAAELHAAQNSEAAIDAPPDDAAADREPEAITFFSMERPCSFEPGPTAAYPRTPASIRTPTPIRARIAKMKRSEFETALTRSQLEEETGEETGGRGLSPEEEAELQRELAAIEADLAMEQEEPQAEEDAANEEDEEDNEQPDKIDETGNGQASPAIKEDRPAEPRDEPPQPQNDTDRECDVSRILDKTNHAMAEPQGRSRRSTIEHLRTAVAATRAEKDSSSDLRPRAENAAAYREDLADAVRPRRPQVGSRSVRPPEPRPAPLKLVAEQRVDADRAQTAIRPRRVSLKDLSERSAKGAPDREPAPENPDSFAKFAATAGAVRLPDLLEAAAAYMAFVEGRPRFSRPQVINKIRQLKQDDFNGESSRRSFGELVSQGKLQKLGGGQFTVSDQINFRPGERHVG